MLKKFFYNKSVSYTHLDVYKRQVNGKIYKTEPFEINVRDAEKKTSIADNSVRNDLYLNLEVQDKEVYKLSLIHI